MRGARRCALVLALIPWLVGCKAVRTPPELSPSQRAALESNAPPRIVVGVRAPVVRLDSGKPVGEISADVTRGELQSARHLIDALRATGLFANVDFVDYLHAAPDVTLISLGPTADRGFTANPYAVLVTLLTVGLVPVVMSPDESDRFARADAPQNVLEFDWRTTSVVGWGALLLLPTEAWRRDARATRNEAFASFLLVHRNAVWGERTE